MKIPTPQKPNARIYIAGPMRGMPEFNYPRFNEVEGKLAAAGWTVENPVKIGAKYGTPEEINANAMLLFRLTDEERRIAKECDAIFMLRGWQDSLGAKDELSIALLYNRSVYLEEPETPTRDDVRKLAVRFRRAAHGRDDYALVDVTAKDAAEAADVLETPTWFSANELRLAADAMDILSYANAEALTLRQRLDAFWKTGPITKNAGSFAAYLHELENGGLQ